MSACCSKRLDDLLDAHALGGHFSIANSSSAESTIFETFGWCMYVVS